MNSTTVATISAKTRSSARGLDVGRIFWKEWRAQRSFWLGLFGLAIGLEILVIYMPPLWRPGRPIDPVDQFRVHQWLVMVLACSFATGSAAIAFAGEVESKTRGLLQRLPARPLDLLAGKLSFSLIGSYLLLFVLRLVGGLMLADAAGNAYLQFDPRDASYQVDAFSHDLSLPVFFVLVGTLFSLLMGEVLLTVLIAGAATAALLAVPAIRAHLTLQAAVLAALVLCDFFLARRWVRGSGTVGWGIVPRLTFLHRAHLRLRAIAEPAVRSESARSSVAWRRAAGSLIWKEFRQAFPFCLAVLGVGLLAIGLVPLMHATTSNQGSGIISLILIGFAPLLPGVAALRAERRDGAFRLLANRGIAPDGFLICKHLVWLSLSLSVFAILFWTDRFFLSNYSQPRVSLWEAAVEVASSTFGSPATSTAGPTEVAAFHVVLLYAVGFLLGLLLPGPVTAFFAGALLCLGLGFCWMVVAGLQIPFWWTVGLLPIIFLAVAWVRTADWMIGRNTLAARGKAVAVFVVPLAGILGATAVYRITEIPAVEVPASVLAPVVGLPAAMERQSLFVNAMESLTENPARNLPLILSNGWQSATPVDKAWVRDNARARKLALEAVQQKPGSFPLQTETAHSDRDLPILTAMRMSWLTNLLLYSARELESRDQLDEALSCYVAIARLGSDAERSQGLDLPVGGQTYSFLALNWMQRWAVHPQQTTQRVEKAIHEFEAISENTLSVSADVLRDWRFNRRQLRTAFWEHPSTYRRNSAVSAMRWTYWLFPWELVRLERLTDAIFAAELREAEAIEGELRTQGFITMTADRLVRWEHTDVGPWKYVQTTLAPPELVNLPYRDGPESYVDRLATNRMNLLALALADFKRVHHKLPESLRELVPAYFARLPIDPWTGRGFLYEAKGLPGAIDFQRGTLTPGTPFLASAGMLDSRFDVWDTTGQSYERLPREGMPNGDDVTRARLARVAVVSRFPPPESKRRTLAAKTFSGPLVSLP